MSLTKQNNGKYLIDLHLKIGGRLRLVAYTDRRASLRLEENIKTLDACMVSGERPDRELSDWLENLPERIKQKLVKHGLLSQSQLEKSKTLKAHLEDFLEYQESQSAKGNLKPERIRKQRFRISRIITENSLIFIHDISASKVDRWISQQYQNQALSAKSCNHYLQALKQFCRWLVENNRIPDNPVAAIKPLPLNSGNTEQRRALTELELAALIPAAEQSEKTYSGLNGYERSLVYQLALTTGLRHNEIRTLVRDDFDFETKTVTVRDINSKNNLTDTLPLQQSLSEAINTYFQSNPELPKAKAFPKMGKKGYYMVQKDLEAAGIEYINDFGKCDFHSLRHTYCSRLARSGLLPQTEQRLMRHSDINLTMRAYTHIMITDKRQAIAALPEIKPLSNENTATGTDEVECVSDNLIFRGGEKLPISAHNAKNCLDNSGQSANNRKDSEINVSAYHKRKNTVKNSVLDDANSIGLNDTDWCRGGDLNPHTLMDKRF